MKCKLIIKRTSRIDARIDGQTAPLGLDHVVLVQIVETLGTGRTAAEQVQLVVAERAHGRVASLLWPARIVCDGQVRPHVGLHVVGVQVVEARLAEPGASASAEHKQSARRAARRVADASARRGLGLARIGDRPLVRDGVERKQLVVDGHARLVLAAEHEDACSDAIHRVRTARRI